MDLFAGTAQYYDDYRPGLPQDVLDTVLSAVKTPVTLLDLGAGTGRITEQFAAYFDEAIAVEPDRDMAKFARRRLEHLPTPHSVLHATAEDMQLPDNWQASLVVICRAFHWMQQHVVLQRLESVVAQDGAIAILADNSFWTLDNPWAQIVRSVLEHYVGPERRTTFGTYTPPLEYFGKSYTSPVFTDLSHYQLPIVRQWTTDQIVGYLYSTSFASHAVLGSAAPAFERHLRTELASISSNDLFTEQNHFTILIARRPQ